MAEDIAYMSKHYVHSLLDNHSHMRYFSVYLLDYTDSFRLVCL